MKRKVLGVESIRGMTENRATVCQLSGHPPSKAGEVGIRIEKHEVGRPVGAAVAAVSFLGHHVKDNQL